MTSARSVYMSVSRTSIAGLCGVGSITLSGGKTVISIICLFEYNYTDNDEENK